MGRTQPILISAHDNRMMTMGLPMTSAPELANLHTSLNDVSLRPTIRLDERWKPTPRGHPEETRPKLLQETTFFLQESQMDITAENLIRRRSEAGA